MRRKIDEDVNGNPIYYAKIKDIDVIMSEFELNHNGLFIECNATFLRVTTITALAGTMVRIALFGAGYSYGNILPQNSTNPHSGVEIDLHMVERYLDDEIDAEYFI